VGRPTALSIKNDNFAICFVRKKMVQEAKIAIVLTAESVETRNVRVESANAETI
jgi:hypothetical protein